nr:hypothetical protein CFP56_08118 [Quercus suber]
MRDKCGSNSADSAALYSREHLAYLHSRAWTMEFGGQRTWSLRYVLLSRSWFARTLGSWAIARAQPSPNKARPLNRPP